MENEYYRLMIVCPLASQPECFGHNAISDAPFLPRQLPRLYEQMTSENYYKRQQKTRFQVHDVKTMRRQPGLSCSAQASRRRASDLSR